MPARRSDENADLWPWLRDSMKGVPHQFTRIESTTGGSGLPDVEGIVAGGRAFWMELKVAYEQPAKRTVRVKTTVHQVFYALRRWELGGLSWYAVRVGADFRSWRHYLIPGSHAEALHDKPLAEEWMARVSVVLPRSGGRDIMTAASRVELSSSSV